MISIIVGSEAREIKEVNVGILEMFSVTAYRLRANPEIKSIHIKAQQSVSETEHKILSTFLRSGLWDFRDSLIHYNKSDLSILFYWILYLGIESKEVYEELIKTMVDFGLDCTNDKFIDKAITKIIN